MVDIVHLCFVLVYFTCRSMDSPHDETDDVPTDIGRQRFVERVTRGRTIMARLIKLRSKGIKLELEWNEKGNPIGENSASLNNFIGTTVRDRVPITITNWRLVKKHYESEIWGEVQVTH